MAAPNVGTPNQESLLEDYVQRLERHKKGRRMVHLHLSSLRPFNRREHHILAASNTFDSIVKMLQGQMFPLRNSDLILIYKKDAQDDVDTALVKIRFLFGDDPLMAEPMVVGENTRFATWYNVEEQYDEILAMARDLSEHGSEMPDEEERKPTAKSRLQAREQRGEKLTPPILDRIESALVRADLTNMVRRQYVCAVAGAGVPQPIFSELFISIGDLRETLIPGVNLASSRWLFQHLTETLDRRILSMLSKTEERSFSGDISINLNVSTLLSPEFLQFDDSVIAAMRGSIVVEIQTVDIFADLASYLFARSFLKERGYRICIDGLTHDTLEFFSRQRLAADMIKLVWNPAMREAGSEVFEKVQHHVKETGESRVILARCDDQDAIDFGQSLGITLFQGRHVENLIAEENRKRSQRSAKPKRTSPSEE